ncbi:TerB N-terminal domain-containing protein [Acinetobacter sp.]|uniref:tellurite resistance TerB family protein n=1 Tax=Acinetobacter sp. TaxID=472 RepID=UPI0025BF808A|nr:TerB N-terminal domain-containing protein [Acinetobacter sp.]
MEEDLTTFIIDKSSNQQELDTQYPNKITLNQLKIEGNKCWIPKGAPITISGITINNGMIYFGEKLHTQNALYSRQDNCLINPKLKVAVNNIEYDSETLPYWSSYSDISPQARYKYLIWLSKGAKDPNIDIGYVFLYFYGLERRLFLEQSENDADNIIDEIKRLITIYGNNNSVNRYLSNALFLGEIIAHKKPSFLEIKINGYKREIPIYIKIYIGTKLKNNIKLDSHDLLLWFCNHPDIFLRTPATRLRNEFIALMKIRINNLDYGSNILVPKKNLHIIYKSCSGSFTVDLSSIINDIPDISYTNSLTQKIQIIANSVMNELENLSRFIGRNPDSIDSIKAFSLLPFELQEDYCTDNIKAIKAWILENYNKQNNITFFEIATKILNLNNIKITSSLHKEICQSLKILGWDMVPYPNEIIGLVKPEMRILFIPYNDQNDDQINISPSENYMLTLIELTLGSYIAHVDKNSLPQQIEYLLERIEKFNHLSTSEKNRLYFYVKWLKIQEIDFTALIRKLKNLDEDSKITSANIAVAVASSKGQILPDEIKALETIYKSMGLDKQALFSSIHSLDKISIHEGIESYRQKINSYSVNSIVCLDSNQIALTLQDTAKASTLLANIFGDNDEIIEEENEICEENILFVGLNIKENNLLQELLTKTEWSHYEYNELANKHKMMPDGAIETINEWAFEVYGEPVIENDGNLIINKNLIK